MAFLVSLVAWRVLSVPPSGLWKDWMVILAVYWAVTVFVRKSPAWPALTASTSIFLLIVHAWGHLPLTFRVLGFVP